MSHTGNNLRRKLSHKCMVSCIGEWEDLRSRQPPKNTRLTGKSIGNCYKSLKCEHPLSDEGLQSFLWSLGLLCKYSFMDTSIGHFTDSYFTVSSLLSQNQDFLDRGRYVQFVAKRFYFHPNYRYSEIQIYPKIWIRL